MGGMVKKKEQEELKDLAIFYSLWHMLDPMTSQPGSTSPEHEAHQAQHCGLKEVGDSRSSPCSDVTEETEDSLGLSWEEMMHTTQIYPLKT